MNPKQYKSLNKNCFKHTKCKDFHSITIHSDHTYAHLSPFNLLSAGNFRRSHPLCKLPQFNAGGFKANGLIWLPCCTVRHRWSGILPRERAAHRHVSSEGKRALADWFLPRSPIDLHQRLHPNWCHSPKSRHRRHTQIKGATEFNFCIYFVMTNTRGFHDHESSWKRIVARHTQALQGGVQRCPNGIIRARHLLGNRRSYQKQWNIIMMWHRYNVC